jgi:hypothetical protein
MPRSNRRRRGGRPRPGGGPPSAPAARGGQVATTRYAGQVWSVREVRGNDSGRSYLCPGCQQQVGAATPHTVVWPEDAMQGIDNRRHWHTPCWAARERRRPGGAFA